MAQNTELRETYSSVVDAKLRSESIFVGLFNQRHDGAATAGAVKIPVREEATVGDYTISTGGTLATPTTSYVTMVCDNDKYVNELIDGFVAAAVPDNMVAERLDSAGFALADETDTTLIEACVEDGTALDSTTALTADTVYEAIIDAIQAAAALKVKKNEMWLAVSNATYGLLLKSDQFIQAVNGLGEFGNGYVGKIGGVNVYETPNIPSGTEFVLGNKVFCHYVADWQTPVAVNDLADGAHIGCSAVQGRQVYGYAITKPTTVLVKTTA